MEKHEEVSKVWNYLGNLEGVLFRIEELQNLLIILEENYFLKNEVDLNNLEDMYSLWREYKYSQSLLSTINYCIDNYKSELSDNIYKVYDSIKILKSQLIIDAHPIVNINQKTA